MARETNILRPRTGNGNLARVNGTIEYFKCNTWNNIRKRVINGKPDSRNASYIRRGVELRITKEEFYKWCDSNSALILEIYAQAKTPSIDRIDPTGHYELSNIQILEFGENRNKRWKDHQSKGV